jgi:hypothetical protein
MVRLLVKSHLLSLAGLLPCLRQVLDNTTPVQAGSYLVNTSVLIKGNSAEYYDSAHSTAVVQNARKKSIDKKLAHLPNLLKRHALGQQPGPPLLGPQHEGVHGPAPRKATTRCNVL